MQELFFLLFTIIVIWYIQFKVKRRRLYELAAQFNGPRPLPIIGNLHSCFVPSTRIVKTVLESTKRYKSPQRLWFGPALIVHIFDPEDLKIVFNSSHALAKPPQFYRLVELILDRGLNTSPVDEWKRHRRLINPCFNQESLVNCFDAFTYHSEELVQRLETQVGKGVFNVREYILNYAGNSVMDALLGCKLGDTSSLKTISNCIEVLLEATTARFTNPFYYFDTTFKMSSFGKEVMKSKSKLDMLMDSIIDKWKLDVLEKHNGVFDKEVDASTPKKFIEHLLEASDGKGKFTTQQLRGEVNTMIIAGFETVSIELGFALVLLGMHPDVQEKLYQEVNVMGTKQQIQPQDLDNLEYLERVIKESMRVFPGAAGILRSTDQDIQLKNHTIPSNTTVVLGLLAAHRNPDIWPNPSKFDPDRFLPEEEAKRHPYSWIPFAAGPRNCIGLRFAWMSLKIALSSVIMKFKITTDYKDVDDVALTSIYELQPTHGFRIGISCR